MLSLADVADRVGVHYMTVYRWMRTGRLRAEWAGGRWAVDGAEVAALLGGRRDEPDGGRHDEPDGGRRRWATWQARLEHCLLAGDEAGTWAVAQAALTAGARPDSLLLEVVAPVMVSIGRRWAAGELTVADEHCASQLATRLIGRLGPSFDRPGRKRRAVVVGTPAGERHALPVAMVVDLLRGSGYRVVDLGVDLPPAELARGAASPGVLAVAVGATVSGQLSALAAAVVEIRRQAPTVPVIVGGAAVPDRASAEAVGADVWSGGDARRLLAVLAELEASGR